MDYDELGVRAGTRIRLSALGKERCPRFKTDTGVIVGRRGPSSLRVKFNGRKQPVTDPSKLCRSSPLMDTIYEQPGVPGFFCLAGTLSVRMCDHSYPPTCKGCTGKGRVAKPRS
jgi:hypothetical protein